MKELAVMTQIQEQKRADIAREGNPELDTEGQAVAREKRESFDLPVNADPLR